MDNNAGNVFSLGISVRVPHAADGDVVSSKTATPKESSAALASECHWPAMKEHEKWSWEIQPGKLFER